jgi:hypothetical protein
MIAPPRTKKAQARVGGEYREGARGIVLKLEQLHGYKYKQNTPLPPPQIIRINIYKKNSLQRRLFLLFFENLVFMRFCGGVFAHDADFARIAAYCRIREIDILRL